MLVQGYYGSCTLFLLMYSWWKMCRISGPKWPTWFWLKFRQILQSLSMFALKIVILCVKNPEIRNRLMLDQSGHLTSLIYLPDFPNFLKFTIKNLEIRNCLMLDQSGHLTHLIYRSIWFPDFLKFTRLDQSGHPIFMPLQSISVFTLCIPKRPTDISIHLCQKFQSSIGWDQSGQLISVSHPVEFQNPIELDQSGQ